MATGRQLIRSAVVLLIVSASSAVAAEQQSAPRCLPEVAAVPAIASAEGDRKAVYAGTVVPAQWLSGAGVPTVETSRFVTPEIGNASVSLQ